MLTAIVENCIGGKYNGAFAEALANVMHAGCKYLTQRSNLIIYRWTEVVREMYYPKRFYDLKNGCNDAILIDTI